MPNFSTAFFNSIIPELSNTYSELEISNDSENESTDNIGLPTYTSSIFSEIPSCSNDSPLSDGGR
jgi:hypothetical protein